MCSDFAFTNDWQQYSSFQQRSNIIISWALLIIEGFSIWVFLVCSKCIKEHTIGLPPLPATLVTI